MEEDKRELAGVGFKWTNWLENLTNVTREKSLLFSPEDPVMTFGLNITRSNKKRNMHGLIVHNKLYSMHLENRFIFMSTTLRKGCKLSTYNPTELTAWSCTFTHLTTYSVIVFCTLLSFSVIPGGGSLCNAINSFCNRFWEVKITWVKAQLKVKTGQPS